MSGGDPGGSQPIALWVSESNKTGPWRRETRWGCWNQSLLQTLLRAKEKCTFSTAEAPPRRSSGCRLSRWAALFPLFTNVLGGSCFPQGGPWCFAFAVLEVEPTALSMLGKQSPTDLHPSALLPCCSTCFHLFPSLPGGSER